MNNERRSEAGLRSLRAFLVRRFVIAAAFIYLVSQVINVTYAQVFQPMMRNILRVDEISYTGGTIVSSLRLLLTAAWRVAGSWLPNSLEEAGNRLLRNTLGANMQAPDFITKYGEGMVALYYTTILMLIVLMLILTLAPYIAMGWWYCKGIAMKVDEIREYDRQRTKQEEKNRNLLFSDIVHDVKTPITTIVGYSRALNDGVITDEGKKQDYLNSIYMKSLRISELITMLFEFVKLDSAGFTLHQENLDLAELLRENVIALFADFEDKGLELDFDIPEEVCMVSADRIQMSRVITNLLTNAIRYSNQGDRAFISMETTQRGEEPYYLISVADSGLEITREFAKKIFEPFSRSDEARQTTSGGSGLGLSIAHKVAAMHGGELCLNLDYGQGYTKAFQIYVPVLKK